MGLNYLDRRFNSPHRRFISPHISAPEIRLLLYFHDLLLNIHEKKHTGKLICPGQADSNSVKAIQLHIHGYLVTEKFRFLVRGNKVRTF
jgi:hypothetical protein